MERRSKESSGSRLALSDEDHARLRELGVPLNDPAPLEVPEEMEWSFGNFFGHFIPSNVRHRSERFRRFAALFPEEAERLSQAVVYWHGQYVATMRDLPHEHDPHELWQAMSADILWAYQQMAQLVDVHDEYYAGVVERFGNPNAFIEQ